ncbi:MAG TPA: hypothetical protein VG276_02195 [Actinomycetes bacterium]|nr:hypothetical protein [Actinomycetes bacterium]
MSLLAMVVIVVAGLGAAALIAALVWVDYQNECDYQHWSTGLPRAGTADQVEPVEQRIDVPGRTVHPARPGPSTARATPSSSRPGATR